MNAIPSDVNAEPHDDLPGPYRIAVQAILDEPAPTLDVSQLHALRTRSAPTARRRSMASLGLWSLASAAAVLIVASLFYWPKDAWSQVVANVRKQTWVRLTIADLAGGGKCEVWMSPAKRTAAMSLPGSAMFLEFAEKKGQRFDRNSNTVVVSDTESFDEDEFAALDTVMQTFGGGAELPRSSMGATKLVNKRSAERREGERRWTEYTFDFEDARRSPPKFQRTFHVPAGTQLATRMVEEWTIGGQQGSRTFEIDYPATGPADLFALNVPKDAKVIDIRSGKELKSLLGEYARQQKTPLDAYTATVLGTVQNWKSIDLNAFRLRFDGSEHAAETANGDQVARLNLDIIEGKRIIPDGDQGIPSWKSEVDNLNFQPYGDKTIFCPGQTFCPDLVGYPLLGLPNHEVRVTLSPNPQIGPADCVMLTVADAKKATTLRRYWFAPERGMMCLRSEISPEKPTDWISTTIIDTVEKSPKGRWYATQVRRGAVEHSGDDLITEPGVSLAPIGTVVQKFLVEFPK